MGRVHFKVACEERAGEGALVGPDVFGLGWWLLVVESFVVVESGKAIDLSTANLRQQIMSMDRSEKKR